MYVQLGLVDLIAAVQKKIQDKTGLKCYDAVPQDAPSPFYFAEVVNKRPAHTKTMWRDIFTVYIHAVARPSASSVEVYKLVQQLEEAMTEDVQLPEEYSLVMQTNNGIQIIKTDETNEKHAVTSYEFMICYGIKCKI